MIELYYWPTPNGHKISIALEEMGLAYDVKPVNIGAGDQFKPDFLAFSPNNRMPAIVDHDGPDGDQVTVFESGAILLYLAQKTGLLMPSGERESIAVYDGLCGRCFGPMLTSASFQLLRAGKNRLCNEPLFIRNNRLYGVLDRRLAQTEYVAGDSYSVVTLRFCRGPGPISARM